MNTLKIFSTKTLQILATANGRAVRKNLHVDTLIQTIREDFQEIIDYRADNIKIPLDDALMSAFAMFHLKDPSLLAFDARRQEEPENLRTVYGLTTIPCDSQMRTILDGVELTFLRAAFRSVFRQIQRGKELESMTLFDGHYGN
jgi:hypothetical protein